MDANDPLEGALRELDGALAEVLIDEKSRSVERALQVYLAAKADLGTRERPFGIVNNRVFVAPGSLIIPYLVGARLDIHIHGVGAPTRVEHQRPPPGTIFTDALISKLAAVDGTPIDLEESLYIFDPESTPVPALVRIRDAAALLEMVNETTNRNQAVFWLRCLAARLCNLSVKDMLGAKNLQPEIHELSKQLNRFLNSTHRRRLLVLSRLIVRNLSSLLGKPNVIDRLWNDTIDLAERHVLGSSVVNELRRTSHHALGKRTLQIAEAYRDYLESGDTSALASLGFASVAPNDVAARERPEILAIVERVVEDLRRLLGTAQIVTRVEEWKEAYADELMRCEFGASVEDELQTLIEKGIRQDNRWVYLHHLRILSAKASSFWAPERLGVGLVSALGLAAETVPGSSGFDASETESKIRAAVNAFTEEVRAAHQDELFDGLGAVISAHEREGHFEVFERTRELRARLVSAITHSGFETQRGYLCQLEGLLEEMGYLALRHIATHYDEERLDIDQCLEIVRLSAQSLRFDGLFSQELNDFAAMLADPGRTDEELLNVLEGIERVYHRIRQRVTVPYEKMKDRLGLDADELRLILANMQRYFHDLNSMVHFADMAATFIRDAQAKGRTVRSSTRLLAPEDVDDAVLHITHRAEIVRRLEAGSGTSSLRAQYGAKGSGLLYISYLNLPTRAGFILPTTFAQAAIPRRAPDRLRAVLSTHLADLEKDIEERDGTPKRFGGGNKPLLLAVRGGSVLSMPGILSTVVFVGMNDDIARELAKDGPWRAYDSYRRFLASYAAAAWNVSLEDYDLVDKAKQRHGARLKQELPWQVMKEVAEESKRVLRELGHGQRLDQILADPFAQLEGAVNAVCDSWNTETAQRFREIKGIAHSWNTSVIVQEMAFGNGMNESIEAGMDETAASLTGVIPRTYPTDSGVRAFEGEIKFSAAGDDLVSGTTFSGSFRPIQDLETLMPMLETRLKHAVAKVRRFMGTDQEVELTVERGVLSILQTRRAEARIDHATERFLDPGEPATRGLGIRGGGFRGLCAFDDNDLAELSQVDIRTRDDVDGVLLIIENPTPADIPMIISADGLLTARGGSSSHAAVAINGIDVKEYSGVSSALDLEVRADKHEALLFDEARAVKHRIRKGDIVSIHGTTGEVYIGSRRKQHIVEQPKPH